MSEIITKEKEATKPTSFRITPETNTQIKELCKHLGCTQDETFKQLIAAFEMQNAISAFPERAVELQNFRTKITELISSYMFSVQLYSDSEARAKAKVDLLIQSKEQTILELQEKIKAIELESMKNLELLNKTLAEKEQLENDLDFVKQQLSVQQKCFDTFKMLTKENELLKNGK